MDQEVKGRKAKTKIEINEILARAFGQFYRRGETTGILRWDEIDNQIQLEAIHISTELAIKNKKNKEEQEVTDTIPRETITCWMYSKKENKPQYHHIDQAST